MVHLKKPIGEKRYKRLESMGKISQDIINSLYSPIDAMSRLLNLALQNIEEEAQPRQFILETKLGLKRMYVLVDKLDGYAKKIEKEFNEISKKRDL